MPDRTNLLARLRTCAWCWAVAAVVLVLGWQTLTVHANYGGNWTGLFFIGQRTPLPPGLDRVVRATEVGYDGQYYRLLAHDPLLRHGTARYLDGPMIRARRILVPAAAWLVAAGRPGLIDGAYILVIAAFICGGVYWLSAILIQQGCHAAFGLLFLAVPATVVSIDRMTVDVALGALTAALAYLVVTRRDRGMAMWCTLAAAGLVRETGLLLAAGCVLAALYRRDWRRAALWLSAALPALAWFAWLTLYALPPAAATVHQAIPRWVVPRPWQFGILARFFHPLNYPYPPALLLVARIADVVGLTGMLGAAILGAWRLRATRDGVLRAALALHVALVFALTSWGFWITPFGYARPLAPLFVLLLVGYGLSAGYRGLARAAACSLLVDIRLMTEIKAQVFGVLRWLAG